MNSDGVVREVVLGVIVSMQSQFAHAQLAYRLTDITNRLESLIQTGGAVLS